MNTQLITEALQEQNADGAWISSPLNIYYLTGYYSEPHERLLALLIKSDGQQILYCPRLELEEVKASPFTGTVIGYADGENPLTTSDEVLPVLAVEAEHLTLKWQRELQQGLNTTKFLDIDPTLKVLRNIKRPDEMNKIKRACELADRCIEIGIAYLKEGCTEREVVNHIEFEIKKYGVSEMSFDTMVLFGDHAASPHGIPGDRKLKNNEYVLFDLGVIYEHYCSDITRTIKFGTPTDEANQIYDVVLNAQEKAIAQIKPGVPISKIDQTARDVIAEAGYGEYFTHRLGHGLGLEAHEYQDISSYNDNPLEAGMVITVEPGIYVPQVAGVRIEDDILVTEEGCEILTHYQK